jgi:hypothetical protein
MLKSTWKMEERMQKLATVFDTLANCGNMKEHQGSHEKSIGTQRKSGGKMIE